MFKTIKSKIFLITVTILFFMLLVVTSFAYIYYSNGKELLVWDCSNTIEVLVQNINKEVLHIENNAKDLALLGEQFYDNGKNENILTSYIYRVFANYKQSLGGGVWFKPYVINKSKFRKCIYAFRNKDDKIITGHYNDDARSFKETEQSVASSLVNHF